jgi:hypothetical protein
MPDKLSERSLCREYLISKLFDPLTANLFTTWEQVRKLSNGYTIEESLDRGNQPSEAYHCQEYLKKCLVSPLTASLFTTWEQVRRLERGFTEYESLYIQTGDTFTAKDTSVTIFGNLRPPDENDFF